MLSGLNLNNIVMCIRNNLKVMFLTEASLEDMIYIYMCIRLVLCDVAQHYQLNKFTYKFSKSNKIE